MAFGDRKPAPRVVHIPGPPTPLDTSGLSLEQLQELQADLESDKTRENIELEEELKLREEEIEQRFESQLGVIRDRIQELT